MWENVHLLCMTFISSHTLTKKKSNRIRYISLLLLHPRALNISHMQDYFSQIPHVKSEKLNKNSFNEAGWEKIPWFFKKQIVYYTGPSLLCLNSYMVLVMEWREENWLMMSLIPLSTMKTFMFQLSLTMNL